MKLVRLIAIVLALASCLMCASSLATPSQTGQVAATSASPHMPLTDSSWNPATKCSARVLTLEQLIGHVPDPKQHPPAQGADYSGGALLLAGNFPPGTNPLSASGAWPFPKRSTSPPCSVRLTNGTLTPTLVEIHGLTVTGINLNGECNTDPRYPNACDETFHLCNAVLAPNCGEVYPDSMHMFHGEIDMSWVRFKTAPPVPPYGSTIDVQGFVYWDEGHLRDQWHSYSGWELHPLTAWRPASGGSPIAGSIDNNPQVPSVGIPSKFTAKVAGGTAPYSYGWNFGDGTRITNATTSITAVVSHSFEKPQNYNVSLTIADSKGFRITVYRFVTVQSAADYDLSSDPTDLTMTPGSTASVTITATSTPNFSGNLDLVTFAPSDLVKAQLDKTTLALAPGSSRHIVLQITVTAGAPIGTYPVIVQGIRQGAVRVARININIPGFQLSVDSSFLEIPPGSKGNFTITITSMGGFSGNVTLAVTSSSSNLESILDTQNVVVTGHGYATANLSVFSLATGSYNVTVTGSRDQLQEVLPLMVNITSLDFDMTISPSNLTITVGQDNSAVLTFTSIGGFSDNINITSSSSPSGPRILVPTQVTLSPGAVIPVNVTVSAGSSAIGKYAINIQGASDDLKHAIKVILNISSNPNQIYYYGGVAAALALGAVVLGLGWPRLKGWIPSMLHTFSRNIRYP